MTGTVNTVMLYMSPNFTYEFFLTNKDNEDMQGERGSSVLTYIVVRKLESGD